MEFYKSTCADCGKSYSWIGYKTGIGKTAEQLAAKYIRDQTICKYCGGKLQTELHTSPETREQYKEIGKMLLGD